MATMAQKAKLRCYVSMLVVILILTAQTDAQKGKKSKTGPSKKNSFPPLVKRIKTAPPVPSTAEPLKSEWESVGLQENRNIADKMVQQPDSSSGDIQQISQQNEEIQQIPQQNEEIQQNEDIQQEPQQSEDIQQIPQQSEDIQQLPQQNEEIQLIPQQNQDIQQYPQQNEDVQQLPQQREEQLPQQNTENLNQFPLNNENIPDYDNGNLKDVEIFQNDSPGTKSGRYYDGMTWQDIPASKIQHNEMRPSSSGVCSVWGPHHYRTFTGRVYPFGGLCTYVLAQDCLKLAFRRSWRPRYNILLEHEPKCHRTTAYEGRCPRPFAAIHIQLQEDRYTIRFPDPELFSREEQETEGAPRSEEPSNAFRVFQGDRELPIPFVTQELKGHPLQRYLVLVTDFGLEIKIDHKGPSITIKLPEKWDSPTCGLCGDTTALIASEDFQSPDGSTLLDPRSFGNSWADVTIDNTCSDVPKEAPACTYDSKKNRKTTDSSTQKCYPMFSTQFAECHKVVEPADYFEACQLDCCRQKNQDNCECSTLAEYFRECARLGGDVIKKGWRSEALCPLGCTNGTVYSECVSACPGTCQNPEPTSDSHGCVDGCHCPPTTLPHEGQCIPRDQCPCELGGKQYSSGQKVSQDCNECECQGGQWKCTNEVCPARCIISGLHHLATFDGFWYELPRTCSFILYYSKLYSLEIENVPCRGSASIKSTKYGQQEQRGAVCSRNLVINSFAWKSSIIKLKKWLEVTVNGEELKTLPAVVEDIYIKQLSSIYMQVELPDGLKIIWSSESGGSITAPSKFFGKTQGLCGTFTHNQADDFLTPEGDTELTPTAFSRKWKADGSCEVPREEPETPCEYDPDLKLAAEELCRNIRATTFHECHEIVDPEPFFRACVSEICNCQGRPESCLCTQLEQYSIACSSKGKLINWRPDIPECGIHCTSGQQYQICVNSCDYSCAQVSTERNCSSECVDGCACPPGSSISSSGKCIPTGQCPCLFNGREYPTGFNQQRKGKICNCDRGKWKCRYETTLMEIPEARLTDCLDSDHQENADCLSECPLTCDNMNMPPKCSTEICREGCRCKRGYVLDVIRDKCVRPEQCPCHHGGKSYADGSAVQMDCNNCLCKGAQWVCEKEECWAQCAAFGSAHYKTFDGKRYDVEGDCQYVLVRGKSGRDQFSVITQNVPCSGSTNVICSKAVTFSLGDESVTLSKTDNSSRGENYVIQQVGIFIHLYSEIGVEILWDRKSRLYVRVKPDWKGKLQGLCGNYDSDATNDLTPPNGGIPGTNVQLFTDSWQLYDYCPRSRAMEDTCQKDTSNYQWAQHQCHVLKSDLFRACHSEVPVQEYLERCVTTTCTCESGGSCDCLCTSISAYADVCASKGVPVRWRSQDLCPIQCPDCDRYNPCIPVCTPDTCLNRLENGKPSCKGRPCVEGCEAKPCPSGKIFNSTIDHRCVPDADCVPKWECRVNGKVYQHGEWVGDATVADPCQTCYCRKGRLDCKGQTCAPTETTTQPLPTTTFIPTRRQPYCYEQGWSRWYNSYTPKDIGDGDFEEIDNMLSPLNTQFELPCSLSNITGIQCRKVGGQVSQETLSDNLSCELPKGLVCKPATGKGAPSCPDYEIRIYCKCREAIKLRWLEPIPWKEEGREEVFPPARVTTPSIPPYECPPENHGWTKWVSTTDGRKDTDGDFETIPSILRTTKACQEMYVTKIQCRAVKSKKPYFEIGQTDVMCNIEDGLMCFHGKQPKGKKCQDYEIRVFCSCYTETSTLAPTTLPYPSTTESPCGKGIRWNPCLFRCDQTCLAYQHKLIIEGTCNMETEPSKCIPGCQHTICDKPGFVQLDEYTCVQAANCDCVLEDGSLLSSGTIIQKGCQKCHCINNTLGCADVPGCGWTTAHAQILSTTTCSPSPTPLCEEGYKIKTNYEGECPVDTCIPECPPDLEWFDCHSKCEPTCASTTQRRCDEGCISGCFCPLGTVRNGDTCIEDNQCPDRVCQGFGDPQLINFDGSVFNFQGKGTFVLANHLESSLIVRGHTDFCSGRIACIVGLRVEYQGHFVDIKRDQNVIVDERSVNLEKLPLDVAGITVLGYPGHNYMVIIPELSTQVFYFSSHAAFSIRVPVALYFNRTKGLCGNCNFAEDDDDLDSDNDGVPDRPDILCSWLSEGNYEECVQDNKIPPVKSDEIDPMACSEFQNPIFNECFTMVDPQPYLHGCQYDVANGAKPKEAVCKALIEFTRQCCEINSPVNHWMETIGCEVTCPESTKFYQCHNACTQTCNNLTSTEGENKFFEKFERLAKGKTNGKMSVKSKTNSKTSKRLSPLIKAMSACHGLKMDGCFCPEGMVFHRGKCMSHSVCDTCDDAGHKPGDSWKEGQCTNCHCDSDLKVVCLTPTCSPPPICRTEEQLRLLPNATENSCCTIYLCEPKPKPRCPPPVVPTCAPGEVAKMKTGKGVCPEYVCECDPGLCPMVRWPDDLEPGQQVELLSVQCCSKAKVVCHPKSCPAAPVCAPGLELKIMKGECCNAFKCKPPDDVCVYKAQISLVNGDEVPITQELQTAAIYRPGETWKDGLCRNCTCLGTGGQYTPECTLEQCPQIADTPDKHDYELAAVPIPHQCCPHIVRLFCKDPQGGIHEVGSEWQDSENNCISYRCEISPLGDVHRVERSIQCTECPVNMEYVSPPAALGMCCGWCRPIVCEENGITYPVKSNWSSTVHRCYSAECIMEGGSVKTIYTSPKCAAVDEDCPEEHIIWDDTGCCQKCNITMTHCIPTPIPLNDTVGMLSIYDTKLGFCKNYKGVKDLKECAGTCNSQSIYSLEEKMFLNNCHCCSPQTYEVLEIQLECAKGRTIRKKFQQPTTCSCTPCDSGEGRNDKSIKGGGVKGGGVKGGGVKGGGIKGGRFEQTSGKKDWVFPEETQQPSDFKFGERHTGQEETGDWPEQSQGAANDNFEFGQHQTGMTEWERQLAENQRQVKVMKNLQKNYEKMTSDENTPSPYQSNFEFGQLQDGSEFGQEPLDLFGQAPMGHQGSLDEQQMSHFGRPGADTSDNFEQGANGHTSQHSKSTRWSSSSDQGSAAGLSSGQGSQSGLSEWERQLAEHQRQVDVVKNLQKNYQDTVQEQNRRQS